ncbi:MAG: type II toxin-antitoxin system VapC family toxin [Spirochaetes bacterium]|nr:type II toxin-antitoxin system VapC family toxin [Spirochaetota bacterium]
MLIDSDVIIWSLRGNAKARNLIQAQVPFQISVVTYMEIVQGMRNTSELKIFVGQLKKWSVATIQIDRDISARAMLFVEDYFLSHKMLIADALIAATAIEMQETLLTANTKHYRHIKNLKMVSFRP